jgi:preprotein translocase subunit SecA
VAVKAVADLKPVVPAVAALEPAMRATSDAELRAVMDRVRRRLVAGDGVADAVPEVFAAVREAARRTIGLRHRDVQVMAGAALCTGMVAEMADGEGKSLTATLPACVGALTGRGVHVITTGIEQARRDAGLMAPVYETLGLSVGVVADATIRPGLDARMADQEARRAARVAGDEARRAAYGADVTYGACDDLAIDHLRDSLAIPLVHELQRGHALAIVDEADLLLVDHPLTPSTISGQATDQEKEMLALVTRRGYLLRYDRLCGLSAAVAPAATALERWFGLDVVQIPLDRPSRRVDHPDVLYLDLQDQMSALGRLVDDPQVRGRPIIIHAPEPHQPEAVERLLDDRGIEHAVLGDLPDLATATREMGRLGRWGRVSVLTRVPRVADVPLGGATSDRVESASAGLDERSRVIDAGGLLVIGLSRHQMTRRIDQRLCELAGRRGEPGETRFLLLFDDEDVAATGEDPDEMRYRLRALNEDGEDSPSGGVTQLIALAQWGAEAEWVASMDPFIDHDDYVIARTNANLAARRWAMHASEAEVDAALARFPGSVAAVIVQRRCPAGAEPARWDLDGVVRDQSAIAGPSAFRRRQLKDLRAARGDRSLVARMLSDAFGGAIEARRRELGGSILARVTQEVVLRVLQNHWRTELRRLIDELAEIRSLPEAEQGPAVTAARRSAPAHVDLDHELVARDVLRYLLHVKVKVG